MAQKNTLNRLKEKERGIRQTLIVDAARQVFGKKTYDMVSMVEIANTAGIAKSSIYTYFKSQEELYAQVVYQDTGLFIQALKKKIQKKDKDTVKTAIDYFLDYYITNEAQWRMITHFALHGNRKTGAVNKLNKIGRELMDIFDMIFVNASVKTEPRLLSHMLFSCLSGVLIAFRNYPGRSEEERIRHMKKIGSLIESMIESMINA